MMRPAKLGEAPSRRESQVAIALLFGRSNKEAGRELGISYRTVEQYRNRLYVKFGVGGPVELVLALMNINPESIRLKLQTQEHVMTEPSGAEIEAARVALSKLCADGCEVQGDTRCCSDPPCPCAKYARAALTAAAQVRERAESFELLKLRTALQNIALEVDRERGRWPHLKRVVAIQCREALASVQGSKDSLGNTDYIPLMPIYGATEDQGDVTGERKETTAALAEARVEDTIKLIEDAQLFWAIEGGPGIEYTAIVRKVGDFIGDSLAGPSAESGATPVDALKKAFAERKE